MGDFEWTNVPVEKRKAVLLAISLTLIGIGMVVAGMILFVTQDMSSMVGLWVCGLLALVPGLYHLRIVWLILKNQSDGWVSWSDVPTV